jgi:hypothetical protein
MDGAVVGFRLKHPHLIEIRQAVPLRVVHAPLRAIRFEAYSIFPAPGANPRSDIS